MFSCPTFSCSLDLPTGKCRTGKYDPDVEATDFRSLTLGQFLSVCTSWQAVRYRER